MTDPALIDQIAALQSMWLRAADGGLEAERSLRATASHEDAAYERGKSDARRFCAESLSSLLTEARAQAQAPTGEGDSMVCPECLGHSGQHAQGCSISTPLNFPELKYTAEINIPCAVCREPIRAGEQCYKHGNWRGDEPHVWRHISHGPWTVRGVVVVPSEPSQSAPDSLAARVLELQRKWQTLSSSPLHHVNNETDRATARSVYRECAIDLHRALVATDPALIDQIAALPRTPAREIADAVQREWDNGTIDFKRTDAESWIRAADVDRLLTEARAQAPSIDCPLCGQNVKQIASATLSLALWQHVNWGLHKA